MGNKLYPTQIHLFIFRLLHLQNEMKNINSYVLIPVQEVMATNQILVVCLDSSILRLFLVLLVLLVLLLVLLHLAEVRVQVEDSWMPQL